MTDDWNPAFAPNKSAITGTDEYTPKRVPLRNAPNAPIVIKHDNAASSMSNRFTLPQGRSFVIAQGEQLAFLLGPDGWRPDPRSLRKLLKKRARRTSMRRKKRRGW